MTREERLHDLLARLRQAGDAGLLAREEAARYQVTRQRIYQDLRELVARGYPVTPAGYGRWRWMESDELSGEEWWTEDQLYTWLKAEGYVWLQCLVPDIEWITVESWWECLGVPRPWRYQVLRGPSPSIALVWRAGSYSHSLWALAFTQQAADDYRRR